MLAPTVPTTYTCRCGAYSMTVAGPSWTAWHFAELRAAAHSRTCSRAVEPWRADPV